MQHLKRIGNLFDTIYASKEVHTLVIESPPGWGKSTLVEKALERSARDYQSVGAYTSPLAFYNTLCTHPDKTIVLDDCAGLFSDPVALSILKAATWSTIGGSGTRRIAWTSSSSKVVQSSIEFSGKLIILTNYIPGGVEMAAFRSRSIHYPIRIDEDFIESALLDAAASSHYENTELATRVAMYILANLACLDWGNINYRTLRNGYEIALANPDNWKELLDATLPSDPVKKLVFKLTQSGKSTKEQILEFHRRTGLSRRTFFYYRDGRPQTNMNVAAPFKG